MNGTAILVFSNVVIDYLIAKLPPEGMKFMSNVVNDIPKISVITKIEVLGYNAPPKDQKLLDDFVDSSVLLELNNEIINQTIDLRKSFAIKIPDAIIAATAIALRFDLVTRNENDFKNIPGLKIVNPWKV